MARAASGNGSIAAAAPLPESGGVVVLDTAVTDELAAEGLARDVIRVVQQARREAGLDISDRITLTVEASEGRRRIYHASRLRRGRDAGPSALSWAPPVASHLPVRRVTGRPYGYRSLASELAAVFVAAVFVAAMFVVAAMAPID